MSSMEDKLASLFRRVRRLQALRLLGDLFSTALTDTIQMSSYVFSTLGGPYRLFEEVLSIAEFLMIRFGGRHAQEYLAISPSLLILYDALYSTLSSVSRVYMGLCGISESLSLVDDILPHFFFSGSLSEDILYHIEVKLLEALDEISKNLRAGLYIGEDVSITEVLRPMFRLSADLEDISEALYIFIKMFESVGLLGLLHVSLFIGESMSILEQLQTAYFALIGTLEVVDVFGAAIKIIETLGMSGSVWAGIKLIEDTISFQDSMEPLMRLRATVGIADALTTLASATYTLYEAVPAAVGNLYAGLMIVEDAISAVDKVIASCFKISQYTTIGEALGSEITTGLTDVLAGIGRLYVDLVIAESVGMTDQANYLYNLLSQSSIFSEELGIYLTVLLTDSIIEYGNLVMSIGLTESIGSSDSISLMEWRLLQGGSIAEAVTYWLTFPPLIDTLSSVGYVIAGISGFTGSLSLADTLDSIESRIVGDLGVKEAIEWATKWVVAKVSITPLDSPAMIM